MKISFVGMSGAGKSTWSSRLKKEKDFKRYCCDDLIAKELAAELKPLGYEGINGLAQWLGQPYDKRYKKNSQRYLELEAKLLATILAEIKKSETDNIILDTTGSVIYMPSNLLAILKKQTKVVYLEIPETIIETMFKKYLNRPKPVIWENQYKPKIGEKKAEALKRCYPKLLESRKKIYEKLAHIKINYPERINKNFTVDNLLDKINQNL